MRTALCTRIIACFVVVFSVVAAGRCAMSAEELNTAEILAEAKASLKTDRDSLGKARLKGRFEIFGLDGKVEKRMHTTFECWVWGDKLRNNGLCDFDRSTFPHARYDDVRSLLLEDGSLYVTYFSPQLKRVGC
ncbi:hypothetical protein [Bremerella alba]|nr:hypothetical protein [Bremerella alba]